MSTVANGASGSDRLRQALNLALAIAQPVTTVLCSGLGTSFDEATHRGVAEPPIIPSRDPAAAIPGLFSCIL